MNHRAMMMLLRIAAMPFEERRAFVDRYNGPLPERPELPAIKADPPRESSTPTKQQRREWRKDAKR